MAHMGIKPMTLVLLTPCSNQFFYSGYIPVSCIFQIVAISKDQSCGIAKEEEEKEKKEGHNDCWHVHQLLIASCLSQWHMLPHELCVPPSRGSAGISSMSEWAALLPEPSICTKHHAAAHCLFPINWGQAIKFPITLKNHAMPTKARI